MSRKLVRLRQKLVQAGGDESRIPVILPTARVRASGEWLRKQDSEGSTVSPAHPLRGEGNVVTEPMKPEKFRRIQSHLSKFASSYSKFVASNSKKRK